MKLTQADINEFFKLHIALLFYVNTKKKVIKGINSPADLKGPVLEGVAKLRDYISKESALIDCFVKENPLALTSEELKTIEGWGKGISDEFFIVKYDDDHTIFYHPKTKKCYGVLSLNDSLADMFGNYAPLMVQAWIVPFKGRIVYDGIIMPYGISFGGGMRKSLKAEYEEAMVKHGVITSFDEFPKKQESDEELLRFYLKSEPNRERHWEEIKQLRIKSPQLETVYHQERGKHLSRVPRAKLKEMGATGHFAVIDDVIVASAQIKSALDVRISGNPSGREKDLGVLF